MPGWLALSDTTVHYHHFLLQMPDSHCYRFCPETPSYSVIIIIVQGINIMKESHTACKGWEALAGSKNSSFTSLQIQISTEKSFLPKCDTCCYLYYQ